MNRLFFVAGESSGDMHGANLIHALRQIDPSLICEGLGGHRMAEAGMTLRHDLAGQAIMGFTEVVKHFRSIRRLFYDTLEHLRRNPPGALILIDYPGFNLRLAQEARQLGIPVVYYISPQVWAWKRKRIHTIARCVRKMLVILPFEETLYRDIGVDCTYVGHPLIDAIPPLEQNQPWREDLVIGLLPGSREQEIERLMHSMIQTAEGIRGRYPDARFVTPCVNAARAEQIRRLASGFPLDIRVGAMHDTLRTARFALVASGTATLETALFGVPMVIVYRVSPVSYWLARLLVRIQYIGIVNILAGRGVVPEFIQQNVVPEKIVPAAIELIADTPARAAMLADFREIRSLLGDGGASGRAASEIMHLLRGANEGPSGSS